jgi:hypothetical protein
MAFADNPLGVYVGAGVGESTVRSDNGYGYNDSFGYGGYYSQDHHFAWKVAAGIRPIPAAGAELEYIDFGHPGSDGDYYSNTYYVGPDSHPRAIAAFGVGHLPLPLPFLDVFGKLGVARLPAIRRQLHAGEPLGYACRVRSRTADTIRESLDTRRVRTDQLTVRRSRSVFHRRHLDLLIRRPRRGRRWRGPFRVWSSRVQ